MKAVRTPEPDLRKYVRNQAVLIVLGKAFFWDMQAGSDGRTACATCHFHAGADHRRRNQLTDRSQPFPANRELDRAHFPVRKLADPQDRRSTPLEDSSVRTGSAGVFRRIFDDIAPGQAGETARDVLDHPESMIGERQVRQVTLRNAPSVINSVFTIRSSWDGSANPTFNGFSKTGEDAPGVLAWRNGLLEREPVAIDRASVASQSVGAMLNTTEMSYEGRTWPQIGKKLLSLAPLAFQEVSPGDSVLGALARAPGRGLAEGQSYLSLIQEAFEPAYWEASQLVDAEGNGLPGRQGPPESVREFTQAEYNFPLFWGLALQAYQSTLVSNDSRLDRQMDGQTTALLPLEIDGLLDFKERCSSCHFGGEFSSATFTAADEGVNSTAFRRTGVRPMAEDSGAGNGEFRSVGLRNVELTGPYFHNGGQATLEEVVDFYIRGGDIAEESVLSPLATTQGGTRPVAELKEALVAFMRTLTDDRVRFERAPFDHPELCVPDGHREVSPGVLAEGEPPFPLSAPERWVSIPAVGASGNMVPLETFEELLGSIGSDGSRAHSLVEPCKAPLP